MENEKNGEQSETNQAGRGNEEYIRQIEALKKEVDEWQMRCFRAEQEVSMLLREKNEPDPTFLSRLKERIKKRQKLNLFLLGIKWRIKFGTKKAGELREEYIRWNYSGNTAYETALGITQAPAEIRFSILVPLYNTPKRFLKDMIESVQGQKYGEWELCLADGSDDEHREAERICGQYAQRDKRIKYKKLDRNRGISGNTNECIAMASGEYLALLDHDDLLHPSALEEVMKVIRDQKADFIYTDEDTFHKSSRDAFQPHYKPDYSPDTLRSYNYICHLTVFRRTLLEKAGGGFRDDYNGSQDYDMILRLTEAASRIVHIPQVLYYWRSHESSVASDLSAKPYAVEAAKKALAAHLERIGLRGKVEDSRVPSTYHIQYEIQGNPKISIIIPNKDHREDLDKCIRSIREKSTWANWEIIIVENNSEKAETFAYYQTISETDRRIRTVRWEKGFDFSGICNFGADQAEGEYILLLNNDIEVITPEWMEEMLMFAQRRDVGAVGAMLYYPDDTIQHAGVIIGLGDDANLRVAGHSHKYFKRGGYGYASRLSIAQNLSAVTGACMMIRKEVYDQVKGLDPAFAVEFNDVDLCLRIREAGYLIVWTPYAELYHYESKSRGMNETEEQQTRHIKEVLLFRSRWKRELQAGDPYYNPNLTLEREDFSFRT